MRTNQIISKFAVFECRIVKAIEFPGASHRADSLATTDMVWENNSIDVIQTHNGTTRVKD